MSAAVPQSVHSLGRPLKRGQARASSIAALDQPVERKWRVYLAAENRLLLEALSRVLTKPGTIDVIGQHSSFDLDALVASQADILLLASRGNVQEDLTILQQVRASAPNVRTLLIGMARDEAGFLQCVRAGISGFLLREASSEEVLAGVRAVYAGEAVCPGALCGVLFRYLQRAACALPLAVPPRWLILTRRERQLLPLIAEGLTSKEIAVRLCLSERTVKNHLHRTKRKLGAQDRSELMQRIT
jgi:DNA-binding NarL/FixJ family response regulator